MRGFHHDRDVGADHHRLRGFGDGRRVGDEVDDRRLRVEPHVDLCERRGRAHRHDAQAGPLQRIGGVGHQRSELTLVMEEQVEIARLAVLGMEAGEGAAARQGPGGSYLRQCNKDPLLKGR